MLRKKRQGLTLIEFLVIVVVIVILIGLLLPVRQGRRLAESAARLNCVNKFKQIGLALHNYESTYGHFPKGCVGNEKSRPSEERLSWYVGILPYLEEEKLTKQFEKVDIYSGDGVHERLELKLVQCAYYDSEQKYLASYVAVAGFGKEAAKRPTGSPLNGFMGYDRITSTSDITDGMSNTICVIETNKPGPWAQAGNSTLRSFDENMVPDLPIGEPFGGLHIGKTNLSKGRYMGTNLLMCDGSVKHIPENRIDNKLLVKLITIADSDNPKDNFDW